MCSGNLEITGRDGIINCAEGYVGRHKLRGVPGVDGPTPDAEEGNVISSSGGGHSRDGRRRVQQAFLDNSRLRIGNSGHLQIDLGECDAARSDAERRAQPLDHAAHGDQRTGDEQSADDDLDEKQGVAHGEAAERAGSDVVAFDRLDDIGVPDLPRRKDAEDDAAGDGESDGDEIDAQSGAMR